MSFQRGIFAKTLDSAMIEVAGRSGLDFVIVDMEHGPVDNPRLHDHVRALALTPAQSFVRVPRLEASVIGAALDAGADGIVVPNVQNADQALQAVHAARFHPLGGRGVCRYVRAARFGETEAASYFESANRAQLACQVEGQRAVQELDAILGVDGIDILFIGPYDLSQSVGRPGEVDCPEVLDLVDDIARRASEQGVRVAAFSDRPELTKTLRGRGVTMLAISVDVEVFRRGLAAIVAEES